LPLFSSRQAGEFVSFTAFRQDIFLTFLQLFDFTLLPPPCYRRPVFQAIQLRTSLEADGDSSPGWSLMSTIGLKNVALLYPWGWMYRTRMENELQNLLCTQIDESPRIRTIPKADLF